MHVTQPNPFPTLLMGCIDNNQSPRPLFKFKNYVWQFWADQRYIAMNINQSDRSRAEGLRYDEVTAAVTQITLNNSMTPALYWS